MITATVEGKSGTANVAVDALPWRRVLAELRDFALQRAPIMLLIAVLMFYPLDWSPVCQGENKCLTDDFPKFQSANAELFGISCDSFFSHKAWADSLDLKHRLLSDVHRTTAKAYGLYFEPLNCSKRATVIVDKNGKVAYAKVQEIKTAREDKEILDALSKLN